jgi:ABC-2 type transport system ATP-binding protein
MSSCQAAIEVEDLRKTFHLGFFGGRRIDALSGISLQVRPSQVFGFLGPNGAGKTTTIKTVAGLIFPSSGTVRVFGGAPSDVRGRARLGYLPENPAFHDHLTGREALRFLGALSGLSAAGASQRAKEVLELTGLTGAADVQVRRYSKGMAQRLGIAQALLHQPELVILDEPMSGLDPVGRREVKEVIRGLRAQGRTVFFSTHIIADVEEICDEVAILLGGRVVRSGQVEALMADSARQYKVVAVNVPANYRDFEPYHRTSERDVFLVPDEAKVRSLLESLWAAGARVHSVDVHRHSLEDLFLAEVRKGPMKGRVAFD